MMQTLQMVRRHAVPVATLNLTIGSLTFLMYLAPLFIYIDISRITDKYLCLIEGIMKLIWWWIEAEANENFDKSCLFAFEVNVERKPRTSESYKKFYDTLIPFVLIRVVVCF